MKTNSNIIDPSSFRGDDPMAVALRLTGRYWHMAMSKLMSMRWEWSTVTPYGATDGTTLILNPHGIAQLRAQPKAANLIAFLLVHEALHALLGHGWRLLKMHDKTLANVAADYVVNALIDMRNKEVGHEVFAFIEGILLDHKLSGNDSVEQLYRKLLKPANQQPQPQPQCSNEQQDSDGSGDAGDDGSDPDSGNKGVPDSDADGSCDGDEGEDGGDSSDGSGDGDESGDSSADGDTGSGDDSTDSEGGQDTGGEGDKEPGDLSQFPGTAGALDNLEPEPAEGESVKEMMDRMEEVNDRILTAEAIDRATMAETGQTGRRIADQRQTGYSLGWTDLLREWLLHHSRNGWDNPFNSAIYTSTGLICAGRRKRAAGCVVWVLDTSGSIGKETYAKFLGEAREALEQLKPEQMVILSVSHQVCDAFILEPGDRVPDSMKGGGGTKFQPAFNWVAENDIEPDVLVYLTDGEATDRATLPAPDYPVLWLSTRKERKDYPFGEVVMVDDL